MSSNTKRIILSKPSDWPLWIDSIKTSAKQRHVWGLVDPDIAIKPTTLQRPIPISIPSLPADGLLSDDEMKMFEQRRKLYKAQLEDFKEESKALADITDAIQDTVSTTNVAYYQNTHDPWSMLQALKAALAPSDYARRRELEIKFEKLKKGPGSQHLETWLDEWQQTYTQAKNIGLPEVSNEDAVIENLIYAIRTRDEGWAGGAIIAFIGTSKTFTEVLGKARQHARTLRLRPTAQPTQSAFAAHTTAQGTDPSRSKSRGPTLRGEHARTPLECLCGLNHWYAECPYLNNAARPRTWKPNPEIESKIKEALNDQNTKDKVDRNIQRQKDKKAKREREQKQEEPTSTQEVHAQNSSTGSYAALAQPPQATTAYATVISPQWAKDTTTALATAPSGNYLERHVILDCGSNGHVINSSQVHLYTSEIEAHPNSMIDAGNSQVRVASYGRVTLPVSTPQGPSEITLLNVSYVPDLLTSIIALSKFTSQGVHFDSGRDCLYDKRSGKAMYNVYPTVEGHFTFHKEPLAPTTAFKVQAFTANLPVKTRTAYECHRVLGHANPDIITHLEDSAEGIKVDQSNAAPRTNQCEPCALSKMKEVVSRSPNVTEEEDHPFKRLTLDIIFHDEGGERYTTHLTCRKTDFNWVYPHWNKSDSPTPNKEKSGIGTTESQQPDRSGAVHYPSPDPTEQLDISDSNNEEYPSMSGGADLPEPIPEDTIVLQLPSQIVQQEIEQRGSTRRNNAAQNIQQQQSNLNQSTGTTTQGNKSTIDTENIYPEGVKRNRKSTRKSVHAALLEDITADQSLTTSYNSFSKFIAARCYYANTNAAQESSSPAQTTDPNTDPPKLRLHRDTLPPEPRNYKNMLNHSYRKEFKEALQVELKKLIKQDTWRRQTHENARRDNKKPIPTTWVFKYKFDEFGYLVKFKARLCVRGDLQLTQQDTYAATLAASVFRTLMALTAAFDLETRQFDVVNAFPHSDIDETTYIYPPEGLGMEAGVLLLLLKALYGLKQAPALWYKHLSTSLVDLGLMPVPGIECVFTNDYMIVFFFVDDIVVLYDQKYTAQVDSFQTRLFQIYDIRYIGELEWFLGIQIIRNRSQRRIWLNQESYIDKITTRFNLKEYESSPKTPLPTGDLTKNPGQATAQDIHLYQQRIGSVGFAAVVTRPDVSYTASKLSEYLQNPSGAHLDLSKRVIRYLHSTKKTSILFDGLKFSPSSIFQASSDASYANDPDTRRSHQGYVFLLFNGPISWAATKQSTVTCSSTEAELLALSRTAKEYLWWVRFFNEIHFNVSHETSIQCDNSQTIRAITLNSQRLQTKLRHIDIHNHWLRQEVERKRISVKWTPSAQTIADGFTKTLTPQRHQEFRKLLGLQDLEVTS